MNSYLYFDSASTTPCCKSALDSLIKFSGDEFGNPSSTHALGQKAAKAVRESRMYFAQTFGVEPHQVVFTGSGTEANNLAILGSTFSLMQNRDSQQGAGPQVLASSVEHAAVRNTVDSLQDHGVRTSFIPIVSAGGLRNPDLNSSLFTPDLKLVSIQTVNNIVGSIFQVEDIARSLKNRFPNLIFHTDAIQAFGKVATPKVGSSVDLLSISSHKIYGPKGIGALIILNKKLLGNIRPLIFGGGQENGFRSGTENPGLIVGFQKAAELALSHQQENFKQILKLNLELKQELFKLKLINETDSGPLRWNSASVEQNGSPYIINLSLPGFPASTLAKMLEERNCLVSVGSACNSNKPSADPVLEAMGFPKNIQTSAFRVSLSTSLQSKDMHTLASALSESISQLNRIAGKR